MSKSYLGIDVSKNKIDVAILTDKKVSTAIFPNTNEGFVSLQELLEQFGIAQVFACLEATGKYSVGIATFLYQQGHQVSVVNPYRIHRYRESRLVRSKTDKIDAVIIALFCKEQEPIPWQPPEPIFVELKEVSRHIDNLMEARQRERNRLKSGNLKSFVKESITRLVDQLDSEITQAKKKLDQIVSQDPALKQEHDLLISIMGIGKLTANRLLAEVQGFSRFISEDHLASYAGLTPKIFSSGSSVHKKARISKAGNTHIRKALYMPALVAKRTNPTLSAFSKRLLANGKPNKLILAAIMRKLLVLAYVIVKSGVPFDPNYHDSMTTS